MSASSDDTGRTNGPIDWVLARTSDLGVTHDNVTIAKSETTNVDPTAYGGSGTPQVGNSWYKFHSLAVDPRNPQRLYAGARYYVWGKDLQSLPGDIPLRPYVATSDDGGKTWAKPIDLLAVAKGDNVAWGGSSPMIVVAPNGDVYGFSKELLKSPPPGQKNPDPRILMFKSTDGAKTWTTSTVNNGGPSLQATPEAAVDPRNGNLYVAYGVGPASTPADQPPPAPQKVFVTTSTDGGKTWSQPTKVDDPKAPQDRGDEFFPNVSVAPNGRVDVAWFDFRNDPIGPRQLGRSNRGERYWDVYYASSSDSGATWSANMRVTSPSIDAKQGATFNKRRHPRPDGSCRDGQSRLRRLAGFQGDDHRRGRRGCLLLPHPLCAGVPAGRHQRPPGLAHRSPRRRHRPCCRRDRPGSGRPPASVRRSAAGRHAGVSAVIGLGSR